MEIATHEVQTVTTMFQAFKFQILVGLKCLVSHMLKDIVVLQNYGL